MLVVVFNVSENNGFVDQINELALPLIKGLKIKESAVQMLTVSIRSI